MRAFLSVFDDGIHAVLLDTSGEHRLESEVVLRTGEDLLEWGDKWGVTSLLCSSSINFPEEETDDGSIIRLAYLVGNGVQVDIVGYEFELDFGDSIEWTQLHGNGGALGNGALHVQDTEHVPAIREQLLRRARYELKHEGTVRRSNDLEHAEPLTIEPVAPKAILACRPIWGVTK